MIGVTSPGTFDPRPRGCPSEDSTSDGVHADASAEPERSSLRGAQACPIRPYLGVCIRLDVLVLVAVRGQVPSMLLL
jgi:hypothetical protein